MKKDCIHWDRITRLHTVIPSILWNIFSKKKIEKNKSTVILEVNNGKCVRKNQLLVLLRICLYSYYPWDVLHTTLLHTCLLNPSPTFFCIQQWKATQLTHCLCDTFAMFWVLANAADKWLFKPSCNNVGKKYPHFVFLANFLLYIGFSRYVGCYNQLSISADLYLYHVCFELKLRIGSIIFLQRLGIQ